MKTRLFSTLILSVFALCPASRLTAQVIVDFEDVGSSLATDSSFRGQDGSGEPGGAQQFSSGGVTFNNQYFPSSDFWLDNAYSNQTSFASGNFVEFAAGNATVLMQNADGSANVGINGSATWGVVTATTARFSAPTGFGFQSLNLHNTQTASEIILNGNGFSTAFDSMDVFSVTINELEEVVGADGTSTFNTIGSVTEDLTIDGVAREGWFNVDLAGTAVEGASLIGFEFSSTDNNGSSDSGNDIFTPAYVAVDDIGLVAVAVPEPNSLTILGLGALTALLRRRKS